MQKIKDKEISNLNQVKKNSKDSVDSVLKIKFQEALGQ